MIKGVVGKTASGLISNSRWNLVAFGASLATQFVTLHFVVRWIGLEAFGVAAVVLAVCAPVSLVGAVLGQAIIREIASRVAIGQGTSISACVAAAIRWCLFACAVGWTALVLIGPIVARPLINVAGAVSGLWPAMLIAASGSVAQQVALVLQSMSAAHQDYRTIARMTLLTALAGSGITLGVTWVSPNTLGYLAGVSVGFVLAMLAWLRRWRATISWEPVFSTKALDGSAALAHFGKWQGVAQLAGLLGNQIDRYALGAMTAASVVGQYSVANRLQEAAYIGVIKVGEVLFPRFGSMASQSLADRLAFFQLASWVVGTLSAAMLAPLAMLSASALTLWVGSQAALGTDHMLFVLVLGGVIGSASNVFTYYAMGIGRNVPVAAISVLFSVLTVIMTVMLIASFGSQAAGMGLLLASVARVMASMVLTRRLFFPGLGWGELFVSTALPVLVGVGIALVGRNFANLRADGWLELVALYAALSVGIFVVGILAAGVTSAGRGIVLRFARSFKRRRQ
jgi:O-antigen/teichoic acid export membrane protein